MAIATRYGRPRTRRGGSLGIAALALLLASTPAALAQTIAITGGKVFPVSGAPIENGTVLIRDGKIAAVGREVAIPSDAKRVDATGKWVTPGLFNSAVQLGLVEIGFSGGPRDASAKGHDEISASFTSWDGFNPHSPMLAETREGGVTTILAMPQGGLVAGQAAAVDLVDGTAPQMFIKTPAAMLGQVGESEEAGVGARGELIGKLRELLEDTRDYQRHKADFERAQRRRYSATRADLEAMIPVVEGRVPFIVGADRASDIREAMQLAQKYGLEMIIAGGAEAWMLADDLAKAKIPVMTGAMNNIPGSFSALGSRQENAALLRKAGVDVIIIGNAGGDEETLNARNVRYEAGNAVAYGMSWDDALRAITLSPAQALGVADRVGSLRAGTEANVVVWSGDPFEFFTRVEHVFVRGREYSAPTRQDLLTARYKKFPPNYDEP